MRSRGTCFSLVHAEAGLGEDDLILVGQSRDGNLNATTVARVGDPLARDLVAEGTD